MMVQAVLSNRDHLELQKTAASIDRHRLHTLFHCPRLFRRFRQ